MCYCSVTVLYFHRLYHICYLVFWVFLESNELQFGISGTLKNTMKVGLPFRWFTKKHSQCEDINALTTNTSLKNSLLLKCSNKSDVNRQQQQLPHYEQILNAPYRVRSVNRLITVKFGIIEFSQCKMKFWCSVGRRFVQGRSCRPRRWDCDSGLRMFVWWLGLGV